MCRKQGASTFLLNHKYSTLVECESNYFFIPGTPESAKVITFSFPGPPKARK